MMRAILPMTRALKAIKAKAPRAMGMRAAAFSFRRRRIGSRDLTIFFFFPRAGT